MVFAPAGAIVPAALTHLEKGRVLALAGICMSDIGPLNYEKHLYQEKKLCSVTASTRQDGNELMHLASQIDLKTKTTEFPLDQANQALQQLKAGKINGAAVLNISD